MNQTVVTPLRFSTFRSDGVVDMTCNEDIVIPPFAEIALSSFSCTPSARTISVADGVVTFAVKPNPEPGDIYTVDLGTSDFDLEAAKESL
jgi:hypothetical protein